MALFSAEWALFTAINNMFTLRGRQTALKGMRIWAPKRVATIGGSCQEGSYQMSLGLFELFHRTVTLHADLAECFASEEPRPWQRVAQERERESERANW